jgi:VIT1/CCC1 family predicted Fe2+/Mn2+ transporter
MEAAAVDMERCPEAHRSGASGWLRAAVLGADDGVVSTASLLIGVGAASASRGQVLLAGIAGLVAGALSMAAGEYVSVSAQRDAEEADVALEQRQLSADPRGELAELAHIYEARGLDPDLARTVAEQLSAHDRLRSHLRDELGLTEATRARPLQAGLVSAASFASLAALPLLSTALAPAPLRLIVTTLVSLATLAVLGALGGHLAGASRSRAAVRVLVGGSLAMIVSAGIGRLVGLAGW